MHTAIIPSLNGAITVICDDGSFLALISPSYLSCIFLIHVTLVFFSHLITLLRCETQNLALVCCPIPYYLSDHPRSSSAIILSTGAQTTILPVRRINPLLNCQATLLFSLLSCRLLLMLCSSERLIFKDTYVYGTEKLDASLSSTLHSDEVSLVHPCESFETHNTTRHTNLQRRDSSASISRIEELLERVHYSRRILGLFVIIQELFLDREMQT